MTRSLCLAALAATALIAGPAAGRQATGSADRIDYEVYRPFRLQPDMVPSKRHARRHRRISSHSDRRRRHGVHRADHRRHRDASASTAGLPGPLVTALEHVQSSCAGFRIISTYRPGARVAGSGRVSLHALDKAADFVVTHWSCAYAALDGFRGGVSTDPGRVGHIHTSWDPGGREWGSRFAHYHGGRYAYRPRHRRYAFRH